MSKQSPNILVRQYRVISFQPEQILIQNNKTRHIYELNQVSYKIRSISIEHYNLLTPKLIQNTLLFPKMQNKLNKYLQLKKNMSIKQYFDEEEIINTFMPILDCIKILHQHNIVHGDIRKENILFSEEGIMKLKDTKKQNQSKKSDDYKSLSLIILECLLLEELPHKQEQIFRKIAKRYSKQFIMTLIIMYFKIEQQLLNIDQYLNGTSINNQQILNLYQKLTKNQQSITSSNQKQQPEQMNNKKNKQPQKCLTPRISKQTPKKFIINTPIKRINLFDVQNKKLCQDDKKNILRSKTIQKGKIIQNQKIWQKRIVRNQNCSLRKTDQMKPSPHKLSKVMQKNKVIF